MIIFYMQRFISINKLKSHLEAIVSEVLEHKVEYIVMVDKHPRFTIKPINDNEGKKVLMRYSENIDKLEKFIK